MNLNHCQELKKERMKELYSPPYLGRILSCALQYTTPLWVLTIECTLTTVLYIYTSIT